MQGSLIHLLFIMINPEYLFMFRKFLQKFSVASCAIREIHPGEEIFTPSKFGRLFNHLMLDLRKITVTPQNRSQHIFLQ